jgi:hypothetical protein
LIKGGFNIPLFKAIINLHKKIPIQNINILFLYIYIVLFGKSKTEKERQQVFDDYMLSILKEREVIKKNIYI